LIYVASDNDAPALPAELGANPSNVNEIVRCTMKSSLSSDEIFSLRLQMKLNPPPLTLRSKISSRSDFIHDSGFIPSEVGFS